MLISFHQELFQPQHQKLFDVFDVQCGRQCILHTCSCAPSVSSACGQTSTQMAWLSSLRWWLSLWCIAICWRFSVSLLRHGPYLSRHCMWRIKCMPCWSNKTEPRIKKQGFDVTHLSVIQCVHTHSCINQKKMQSVKSTPLPNANVVLCIRVTVTVSNDRTSFTCWELLKHMLAAYDRRIPHHDDVIT